MRIGTLEIVKEGDLVIVSVTERDASGLSRDIFAMFNNGIMAHFGTPSFGDSLTPPHIRRTLKGICESFGPVSSEETGLFRYSLALR